MNPNLNYAEFPIGYPLANADQTSDTGTTYIDQSGKTVIKILGSDKDGKQVIKKYRMVDVDEDKINPPVVPDLSNLDGSTMKLNQWQSELQGRTLRNDTNANWDNLEKAVNLILDNQSKIDIYQKAMADYVSKISVDYKDTVIDAISQYLSDNYYPKSEIDAKVNQLHNEILNITSRLPAFKVPNSGVQNPSRTDPMSDLGYRGETLDPDLQNWLDVNDKEDENDR